MAERAHGIITPSLNGVRSVSQTMGDEESWYSNNVRVNTHVEAYKCKNTAEYNDNAVIA